MPQLSLPADCVLDEYDTNGTWADLAAKQGPANAHGEIEISTDTFEEGDCAAFLDRNDLSEPLTRKVFVLAMEDHVLVFDEDGKRIDEPKCFVYDGKQALTGDGGFLADWGMEYYKAASGPAVVEKPPAPPANIVDFPPGVRFQECLKQSDEDTTGVWYGGTIAESLDDARLVMAYDDGDLSSMQPAEVRGLFEMGRLSHCTVPGGLVADKPTALRALTVSHMKCGDMMVPVGVMLHDAPDSFQVGGFPFYSTHVVNVQALTDALLSSKKAPSVETRGAARHVPQDDERHGYHTFNRGDWVTYMGGGDGPQPIEIVWAVCHHWDVTSKKPQHHRYLITFDKDLQEFSCLAWTSWRRLPAVSGDDSFDPDTSAVQEASQETIATMAKAWETDTHIHVGSSHQLKRLLQLGPAQMREKKKSDLQKKERLRKAGASKKKQDAADAARARKLADKKTAEKKEEHDKRERDKRALEEQV